MNDDKLYITQCNAYIEFMLSNQQWTGFGRSDIDKWISNFSDFSQEEMVYVYKLLVNLIYYSENDIISILDDGIYECVYKKAILEQQIKTGFKLSQQALSKIKESTIEQCCFIPLLDNDSPHESGLMITRLLVQNAIISGTQSIFAEKLPELFEQQEITHVFIVDDCVGSGQQFNTFWNESHVELKEFCTKKKVSVFYLSLFGYSDSIKNLRQSNPDIQIHCMRELQYEHRVFGRESYIWKDELEKAKALFLNLLESCNIPLLGFSDLDFAFVMHKTIPDWSLPMFWKENSDWNLLLRRKNSNG